MIHYIYKIVHTNGKYYIGRHSTKNIDDGYMGSGKWPRSIKNKKELSKVILAYYDSSKELLEAEKSILAEHISNKMCMNFNNNPVGFASGDLNPARSKKERIRRSLAFKGSNNPMFNKVFTEEEKQRMSNNRKGKPTWNKGLKGIKTSDKGQNAWNKGIHTGYQSFIGKKHKEESILKMKEGHTKRAKLECPHCCKVIDKPNYTRYHGDKCRFKC